MIEEEAGTYKVVNLLLYFPSVVGFEKFGEVMVLLYSFDIFDLFVYTFIVCRCFNISDYTQSDWETIIVAH